MARNDHQYKETALAQGSMSVPTLNQNIRHTNSVTTPEWMIMIDDLLSSTIEGTTPDPMPEPGEDINFTQCAELFGWIDEQARLTKGNTGSELLSTSAVQQSCVVVVIPNGSYAPSLENHMYTGTNVSKIHLIRLGNIGDLKLPIQIVSYTTSKIESVQQKLDEIVITLRPATRQNTVTSYSQDGTPKGNNVSGFDFTKGEAVGAGGAGGAAAEAAG